MSRGRAGLTAVLAAVAVLAGTGPALAASGSGTTPTFTVNYTVGDVAFDGPGCVQVPIGITYTLAGAPNGYVTLNLGFPRSNAPVTGTIIVTAQDPPSGSKSSEVTFCPQNYVSGRGPLQVTGVVVSPRGGVTSQLTPSTAAVNQNPVRMSRPKVRQSAGNWTLSGSAEAKTATRGWVGATGAVTIQLRRPGASRWVSGETVALDQFGSWRSAAAIPTAVYPRGTSVRAVLTGCNWCKNSSVTTVLR